MTVKVCAVKNCGRPVRSRGLCQTHYKHMRQGKELKLIPPRRAARENTQRCCGLSLTARCVRLLMLVAERDHVAPNAVVTDVLERWAERYDRSRRKP
jgi:hypothetical protein